MEESRHEDGEVIKQPRFFFQSTEHDFSQFSTITQCLLNEKKAIYSNRLGNQFGPRQMVNWSRHKKHSNK